MQPDKGKQIKQVVWLGIFLNIFLAGIKFVAGILGNSRAVIADAFHSLTDMSTDFAVLLGVPFWTAPPDEDHPYGHGRIESLVTIFIGLVLVSVAVGIGFPALIAIGSAQSKTISWVAIIGPAISILVKEFLYYRTRKIGESTGSQALIANAWHHRSDSISSVPALIAVLGSSLNPKLVFLDQAGAVLVSLFILKVSWDILKPALLELTDGGASKAEVTEIKRIALSVLGVKEVHAIRTRKFNSKIYVDLHTLVDPEISVRDGHLITEIVKSRLIEQGPGVMDVVVHLEPYEADQLL